MIKIVKLFPGGKKKAFTLSYDDGVTQDKRLVEIFNRYGLKATFNLNSGLQGQNGSFVIDNLPVMRLNREEAIDLYKGHEIAVHGYNHLSLMDIPVELILAEVLEDKKNLEGMFKYPIRGMAYPNGVYDEKVIEVLKTLKIAYSRTVDSHGKFSLPSNYLKWNPTAHHNDPHLMDIAKRFVEEEFRELGVFYLWGHSYEFDLNDNWHIIEEFSEYISKRDDIWYATNIEIFDYLVALDRLDYSADFTVVHNPSAISIWIGFNGTKIEIKGGELKKLTEG